MKGVVTVHHGMAVIYKPSVEETEKAYPITFPLGIMDYREETSLRNLVSFSKADIYCRSSFV